MSTSNKDYQIIDGKPHLGLFFGQAVMVNEKCFKFEDDPILAEIKERMMHVVVAFAQQQEDMEIRHIQWIIRPPIFTNNPLNQLGSVALKFMLWGRAFKVMFYQKTGAKRYKKVYISGKRKRVRVDN